MSWDIALRLGRVSNLPTVWTNALAAIILSGGSIGDWRFPLILVAMSLFYLGGMYLNDAFDADIDAVERPERPIPSGQIDRATVYGVGFGMLAAGIVLLIPICIATESRVGYWAPIGGIGLAAAIVFYDWNHKANPLSPFIMGLCRALVYITCALSFVVPLPSLVIVGATLLLSYLIGLTYVAKQETLGRVENLWPLAFLAAPVLYGAAHLVNHPLSTPFLIALAAWISVAVWLVNRRQPGDIPRAVVSLIAGISLLDALLIASTGQAGLAVLAVAGFALTLFLQRYVSGT